MHLLPASWIVSLGLGSLRNHLNTRKRQSEGTFLQRGLKVETRVQREGFSEGFLTNFHLTAEPNLSHSLYASVSQRCCVLIPTIGRVLFSPKALSAQVIKAHESNVSIQQMQAKSSTSGENTLVTTLFLSHLMSPEKEECFLFATSCMSLNMFTSSLQLRTNALEQTIHRKTTPSPTDSFCKGR